MKKGLLFGGLALGCVLWGGLYGLYVYMVKTPAYELHIMHTNDLHAHLTPFHLNKPVCTYDDKSCKGGFARLKTAIDAYRKKYPEALLLDGGDRFSGTFFYNARKGKDIVFLMNQMKYDALALGNHDFDDGLAEIEYMAQNIQAPIVAANVSFPETSPLARRIVPAAVIEKGGVKIGVIGALTPDVKVETAHAKEIALIPLLPALQQEIDALQRQGVNIILVLSHIGDALDDKLADSLRGVDIIIGAHSHTRKFKLRSGVLIASAGWAGEQAGAMRVVFNRLGQMMDFENETLPLDNRVPADKAMRQYIEDVRTELDFVLRKPVTFLLSPVSLTPEQSFCGQDCHIGEALADALLAAFPEADMAFLNGGAIRAGLAQGDVSVGDIMQAYPFDSPVVSVEMSGAEIKHYLTHGIQKYRPDKRVNALIHAAGLSYRFSGQEKVLRGVFHRQQPIAEEKKYKVLLSGFLAAGGDAFPVFEGKILAESLRDSLIRALKGGYPIKPLSHRVQAD